VDKSTVKVDYIIKKISNTSINILAITPIEALSVEKRNFERKYQNNTMVNGFRRGKIPNNIFSLHYKKRIFEDVKKYLVNESFKHIKLKNNIETTNIKLIKTSQTKNFFIYEVLIEVLHEIKKLNPSLENVKSFKYTCNTKYENLIERLVQDRYTLFKNSKYRQAKKGYFADISYNFYDYKTKKLIPGLSKYNILIQIENFKKFSNTNISFIDNKVNETSTKHLQVPESFYVPSLRNRQVLIKTSINNIKEKTIPLAINLTLKKDIDSISANLSNRYFIEQLLKPENARCENKKLYENIVNKLYRHKKAIFPQSSIDNLAYELIKDYTNNENLVIDKYYLSNRITTITINKIREYVVVCNILDILSSYNDKNINEYLKNVNKDDIIRRAVYSKKYHMKKQDIKHYNIFRYFEKSTI